jgi:hypothetical protein
MTTIAKGNADQFSVYVDSSVTFTPGSGGSIKFGCSSPAGVTRPIDRPIYAAETITIPAGSTVFVEAVDADGAYVNATEAVSTPFSAAVIAALQAVPGLGGGVVTLTASRALAASDAGKTLVYAGSTNITLTTVAGLGSFVVLQAGAGRVNVAGARGIPLTIGTARRVTYTETSAGVYEGSASANGPIVAQSTVCMGGDSIFAYGKGASINIATGLNIVAWASSQMHTRLDIMSNVAVGGHTIEQFMTSQLASIVADTSAIAWIHIGVNSLASTISLQETIETAEAKIRTALVALSASKQCVIWDSINPFTWTSTTNDRALEVPLWNEMYARVCSEFSNVIFNDTYSELLNTASLIGDIDADKYTFDNTTLKIHQNTWGAKKLGFRSAQNLRDRLIVIPAFTATKYALPDLSGTTGTKTPGSGTITGNAPTNVTVQCSAGTPAVTLTPIEGGTGTTVKRLNMAITFNGATDAIKVRNSNTTAFNANFVTGDKVRLVARVRAKSQDTLKLFQAGLFINSTSSGVAYVNGYTATETPNIQFPDESWVATFQTPPYTIVEASITSMMCEFLIWTTGAGAADLSLIDWWFEKIVEA